MKKFFVIGAAAILLLAAFGAVTACSGSFTDPGWHEAGGGGGSGGKPAKLSSDASYQDALDKLDEIIDYTSRSDIQNQAENLKSNVELASSAWSSAGTGFIVSINALIAML
jgi:hypothetical protein